MPIFTHFELLATIHYEFGVHTDKIKVVSTGFLILHIPKFVVFLFFLYSLK